ncbi:MAG: sigma-70 factor domain-containing protein, partial [Planctomycetota bacterium]
MIDALPEAATGTTHAWVFPSHIRDELFGAEVIPMGKKFSRRSLQDDAFDAEDAVSRRSRTMGQEFADAIAEDAELALAGDDDPSRREEFPTDPTEDPVRMYLMQMGQIPLLTRDQEVSAAKQIEATRDRYRHCMMATDFMLQAGLKLLQQVRDKQLRLDRTIEV